MKTPFLINQIHCGWRFQFKYHYFVSEDVEDKKRREKIGKIKKRLKWTASAETYWEWWYLREKRAQSSPIKQSFYIVWLCLEFGVKMKWTLRELPSASLWGPIWKFHNLETSSDILYGWFTAILLRGLEGQIWLDFVASGLIRIMFPLSSIRSHSTFKALNVLRHSAQKTTCLLIGLPDN